MMHLRKIVSQHPEASTHLIETLKFLEESTAKGINQSIAEGRYQPTQLTEQGKAPAPATPKVPGPESPDKANEENLVKMVSAANDINQAYQEATNKADQATLATEQAKANELMAALQHVGDTPTAYGPSLPTNEINPSPY